MAPHVLVADDDPLARRRIVQALRRARLTATEAESGERALELARSERPDAVLLDVDLPDRSGLDVLHHLSDAEGAPAVLLMASAPDVSTAVEALRRGAADLLEKPVAVEDVPRILGRVLRPRAVRRERDLLRDEVLRLRSGRIVGRSAAIGRVLEHVQRVAAAPRTTVLVLGESGVGKELVARAVHESSRRSERPFVAVNCAALSESLLEAELFGYEPGAFTGGARKGHEGLIAAAEGGTLFLDEVGELAPTLQAKLLRVLQERSYRRVGATGDRAMDVRVVASTNRDLAELVEQGSFRADLFYRLNVLTVRIPPMRERREDVVNLAEHFRAAFAREFAKETVGFSPAALEQLERHDWPGNVRELRNAVERATLLVPAGDAIGPEHLVLAQGMPIAPSERSNLPALEVDDLSLRSVERALIQRVLAEAGGNRSQAARILGVNRTTLYNKLRAYSA